MTCGTIHINFHDKILLKTTIETLNTLDLETRRCLIEQCAIYQRIWFTWKYREQLRFENKMKLNKPACIDVPPFGVTYDYNFYIIQK